MTPIKNMPLKLMSLLFIIFTLFAMFNYPSETMPYARFEHPSGDFVIIVTKNKIYWPFISMPGQGSDSPGIAKLLNREGGILDKKNIEMLQLVDHVEWHSNRATIMPGVDLFYYKNK